MSEEEEVQTEEPVKSRREVIEEALGAEIESSEETPDSFESPEEPSVEAEAAEEGEPEGSTKAPEKDAKPVVQNVLPPQDLSPEERAEFEEYAKGAPKSAAKLAKRFQDYRRDYTQKTMELGQVRQRYAGYDQVAKAHEGRLARKNLSVEQAMSNALAWDQFIDEQGINGIVQYVEKHGYDVRELADAVESGEAFSGKDQPQIPEEIQRELEESRRFRAQLVQERQASQVDSVFQTLNAFKASKPIFEDPSVAEEVEAAMTPIYVGLQRTNPNAPAMQLLEKAYSYVINGEERFRALSNGASQRKQIEAQRDRSARARAASSVAGSGPGVGSPASIPKTRRGIIAAAMDGRL